MKKRNLFPLLAILLFVSASTALAQIAPPPPPSQPAPPTIATPAPPPAPMAFSFSFEGGSYLGIVPEDITRENMSRYGLSAPRGVGVSSVSEDSPAAKAGLKKGDVILQFDGEAVTSNRKLLRLIGESAPEQTVRLTISRNGSEQQLTVTLGQRADATRLYRDRVLTPAPRGSFPQVPGTPRVWGNGDGLGTFYLFGSNRRVGITSTTLTKQLAEFFGVSGGRGLLITSVSENSPASKAGLRAGDVITEVNGERVEDTDDFLRALNRKEEGEVTLTIIRDKSQRTIKVTPERRTSPSFNMSEIAPAAMLGRITLPEIKVEIPAVNIQAMPAINIPVMPKIEIPVMPRIEIPIRTKMNLKLPRLKNLPRIEKLETISPVI
ncbi:MAG TPA: PDZ domain-containing protein [Pyrinomonadaceae bacterium]